MKSTPNGAPEEGTVLQAALQYARLGWPVLTVWRTNPRGVCGCPKQDRCRSPGKHPRSPYGCNGATTDAKKLRTWKWQTGNIGIATGRDSGLLVLDIDPRNGGPESIRRLIGQLGKLPPGPRVKTGGGGWHLYFRYPDLSVRGSPAAPGIDLKGDGGFVVAPPSVHPTGNPYTWETPPGTSPVPALPAAWLDWLSDPDRDVIQRVQRAQEGAEESGESKRVQEILAGSPASRSTIDQAILATLPKGPGQRHAHIFKLARKLQGIVGTSQDAMRKAKPIVREWHRRALPVIRTKEWEATWFDFTDAWERVRYPGDSSPLAEALSRAKAKPLPSVAMGYDDPKLQLLVALCRELQRDRGEKPFFLSCEDAAGLIGDGECPSPMTIWRWLMGLHRDGVLRLETKDRL